MSTTKPQITITDSTFACHGDWTLTQYTNLTKLLADIPAIQTKNITISGKDIAAMDSAGALLLMQWVMKLKKHNFTLELNAFNEEHQQLMQLVKEKLSALKKERQSRSASKLTLVGKYTVQQLQEFYAYFTFVGMQSIELLRILRLKTRVRWSAYAATLYRDGFQALPIIALLSFMIGVVITYQMGLQLRNYGANVYIVDLLGISILREFGPLLTAIMIAGRTGSAFTAHIGIMKLNQEIDALNTLGITPAELLILPRIIGLFIALPLLTIWSDIFGVVGGMVMSNNMLNITWYDFLHRFPHVIKLKNLLIGLGKAPVFALIIASIGCFRGMQVSNGALSLGVNTTRSVVLSIFFIIVADAFFSIIFSQLKL